jgi:hypothetical protein
MVKVQRRFISPFFAILALASVLFLLLPKSRPFSLSIPHRAKQKSPVWLIATISPAHSQQRRNIIRATWQTYYRNPAVTTKFVISNPGDLWMPLIQHENATYGDLILMADLEESAHIANTVKTLKFFTYLAAQGPSHYKFVSKLDDDSFLDVPAFYEEFIIPRLEAPDNGTMIGRQLTHPDPRYPYPGGQFYTVSWNMLLTLVRLYATNPIDDEHEDVLVARLLYEGGVPFELVTLSNQRAFDLDEGNSNEWDSWHSVMDGSINPHAMKDDEVYLRVAAFYGGRGPNNITSA